MLNKDNLTRKASLKYLQIDKVNEDELRCSTCSITISVGQPAHEGDKFRATLIVVNAHFEACTIMLCDSLQRHNLQINSNESMEVLHTRANALGDLWLAKNLTVIQQLDIPYDIVRWDYWLLHPDYAAARALIEELHRTKPEFGYALETIGHSFVERYRGATTVDKTDLLLSYSKEYLKEECAAMLLWVERGFHFEIYPSHRNAAMDYVHQHVIVKQHPNLLRPLSLKFKNILSRHVGQHIGARGISELPMNEHAL